MTTPIRALTRLKPAPSRWPNAWRSGVCAAIVIGTATALGQPALGLVASVGAFAPLYGGRGPVRREAVVVVIAAVGLALAMLVGSSASGIPWLAVILVALWTAVASAATQILNAPPPGQLMFVLTCAVGAGLPAGHAVGYACVVLVAGVVGIVLTVLRPWRAAPGWAPPVIMWRLHWVLRSPVPRVAWRTALGVGSAGLAAVALGLFHPSWAMIAAVAVLAQGTYAAITIERALLRGVGAIAGCVVAIGVLLWHPRDYAAAVLVGGLLCMIELTAARNHALAMVFITPLSLTLVTAGGAPLPVLSTTGALLTDTALGCVAAVIVGQLVSTTWVDRQSFYVVNGVLKAATATLDDHGRVAELTHARARAAIVRQRMMGERRGVRPVAAAWQELAADCDAVAGRVMAIVDGESAGAGEAAAEIRRLAERAGRQWAQTGQSL
ncbi:FUSC family protein [Kutzneria buriramensis]|uniref:Fusaric acid resistance family protein n=1 Tax=Kutzneria buriramensis TaxID=1045776 RepID=A0A3E0GXG2_9PSEU|nr:FUSC family protein [Kutzneria buriramensis]REH33082.1 fusaric acid resistance family protein [Kutzneria buriramensis]